MKKDVTYNMEKNVKKKIVKAYTVYYICCAALLGYILISNRWIIHTFEWLAASFAFLVATIILYLGWRSVAGKSGKLWKA
ncbi:MAG: hypothetical protein HXS44_16585 [Theionarchaea archaeon]|nr:hypothetical protein [Theionarchaea archaeon]